MAATEQTGVKYPHIEVQITCGDGNIFMVAGRVGKALRRAGAPQAEIDAFYAGLKEQASYADALNYIERTVNVC